MQVVIHYPCGGGTPLARLDLLLEGSLNKSLSISDLTMALGVTVEEVEDWLQSGALECRTSADGRRRVSLTGTLAFLHRTGLTLQRPGSSPRAGSQPSR